MTIGAIEQILDYPGVYKLYLKADVVYIGKSDTSARGRILSHVANKDFDRARIRYVPRGQCRHAESREIAKFKRQRGMLPLYNRVR